MGRWVRVVHSVAANLVVPLISGPIVFMCSLMVLRRISFITGSASRGDDHADAAALLDAMRADASSAKVLLALGRDKRNAFQ